MGIGRKKWRQEEDVHELKSTNGIASARCIECARAGCSTAAVVAFASGML
jgi:hypothetical protein